MIKWTAEIPDASFPVPLAVKVKELRLTGSPLVLLTANWATETASTPGSWIELSTDKGPKLTFKTGWVGVLVTVKVVVGVEVGVVVKVEVAVGVGVEVNVSVGVVVDV
jgi:hypothetical protein